MRALGQSVKQWSLGLPIGSLLLQSRGLVERLHASRGSAECAGTIANDQLATKLVTRLARPGTDFVDVGAHIGSVISAVHRWEKSVRITAIEAIPEKAQRLRTQFLYATTHACAVGEREETASFHIDVKRSGYSSLASLPTHGASGKAHVREVKVPVRRLDELIPEGQIDVIKIDVEGAELGVLKGGSRLLERNRPVVMFESGPADAPGLGYTKEALWQFLTERDYALLIPNRVSHLDGGLSLDGFLESHVFPRRTTNYFAVPREKRADIRTRARKVLGMAAS